MAAPIYPAPMPNMVAPWQTSIFLFSATTLVQRVTNGHEQTSRCFVQCGSISVVLTAMVKEGQRDSRSKHSTCNNQPCCFLWKASTHMFQWDIQV